MFYCSPALCFYIPHLLHIFFFEPHFAYVYVCYNWFFDLISTFYKFLILPKNYKCPQFFHKFYKFYLP